MIEEILSNAMGDSASRMQLDIQQKLEEM